MQRIQVNQVGGPEVMELVAGDTPQAGPGEVTVEVAACGVNFIDTYQRSGLYQVPLPFTPGNEGAGTVTAVGEGVTSLEVGDTVAWTDVMGSYATVTTIPADRAVAVPSGVDTQTAAAVMLQGLTAHYLAKSTFELKDGSRCLIHAGAGGVGRLLIQIAKRAGAEVFTTVGSADKAEAARAAGADHVINYNDVSFVEAVEEVAGPHHLDVVYDGVGATTFEGGLDLLAPRGTMVTFGNASGPAPAISPLTLMTKGSLFLTRPMLGHYIVGDELAQRSADLFAWIAEGHLDVLVGATYPLAAAADAHQALEGRQTTGKVLLVP